MRNKNAPQPNEKDFQSRRDALKAGALLGAVGLIGASGIRSDALRTASATNIAGPDNYFALIQPSVDPISGSSQNMAVDGDGNPIVDTNGNITAYASGLGVQGTNSTTNGEQEVMQLLSILFGNRKYKIKVRVVGNLTTSASWIVPSWTILEILGAVSIDASVNQPVVTNSNAWVPAGTSPLTPGTIIWTLLYAAVSSGTSALIHVDHTNYSMGTSNQNQRTPSPGQIFTIGKTDGTNTEQVVIKSYSTGTSYDTLTVLKLANGHSAGEIISGVCGQRDFDIVGPGLIDGNQAAQTALTTNIQGYYDRQSYGQLQGCGIGLIFFPDPDLFSSAGRSVVTFPQYNPVSPNFTLANLTVQNTAGDGLVTSGCVDGPSGSYVNGFRIEVNGGKLHNIYANSCGGHGIRNTLHSRGIIATNLRAFNNGFGVGSNGAAGLDIDASKNSYIGVISDGNFYNIGLMSCAWCSGTDWKTIGETSPNASKHACHVWHNAKIDSLNIRNWVMVTEQQSGFDGSDAGCGLLHCNIEFTAYQVGQLANNNYDVLTIGGYENAHTIPPDPGFIGPWTDNVFNILVVSGANKPRYVVDAPFLALGNIFDRNTIRIKMTEGPVGTAVWNFGTSGMNPNGRFSLEYGSNPTSGLNSKAFSSQGYVGLGLAGTLSSTPTTSASYRVVGRYYASIPTSSFTIKDQAGNLIQNVTTSFTGFLEDGWILNWSVSGSALTLWPCPL